jgi:peptidoglycan/xylan/chitin deacetylase (PgdA/CDA1 family)
VIRRGNPGRMAVALSFDAGADAGYAGLILDTLSANGILASFGMTGRWAEQNPDLVQRMVSDGHHLINHSYDHASMTGASTRTRALTREERWWQLDRTEEIIVGLTGATTKPFFRPPYGAHDASVNEDVGARGYAYNVLWTVDSRGWMGWAAGAITQRCSSWRSRARSTCSTWARRHKMGRRSRAQSTACGRRGTPSALCPM